MVWAGVGAAAVLRWAYGVIGVARMRVRIARIRVSGSWSWALAEK